MFTPFSALKAVFGKQSNTDKDDIAGEVLAAFIDRELANERARRAALEARTASVITASGSFVTLTFGLGALVTKAAKYQPSRVVIVLLAVALLAFVLSATFALLAGRLVIYKVVTPGQLDTWRQDRFWLDTEDNARWLLAAANTRTIESLRSGNDAKATKVEYALASQIAAFALLGATVVVILIQAAT